MNTVIPTPGDALFELTAYRAPRSKTFHLGGDKRRLIVSQNIAHYIDPVGGKLADVDPTFRLDGGNYIVDKACYDLTVTPGMDVAYTSKRGGYVKVALKEIDGVTVGSLPTLFSPVVGGHRLKFSTVVAGLDIIIEARSDSIEIYKTIDSLGAPHELKWEVIEDLSGSHVNVQQKTWGVDANGYELEIITTVTPGIGPSPSQTAIMMTEQVTGYIFKRDPDTRVKYKAPINETTYPLHVDVTVNEDIAANADDGWWYKAPINVWYGAGATVRCGYYEYAGFRFQTVAVPQGVTIDSAVLDFYIHFAENDRGAVLRGNDVDDAAVWGAGDHPLNMATTAASATITAGAPGFNPVGTYNLTITAIVQEIVNRGGWVSGNDMKFGFTQRLGIGNTAQIRAHDTYPADSANLTIDYTAAGVAIPVVSHHYRQMGGSQ